MQLLCIDTQVPEAQVFVDSVNAQTSAIVCSTMPPFLPDRIDRIGFVFILDKGLLWFGPEQEKRMVQLIRDREIKQIDFLACNTLHDPIWCAYYTRLTEQTGVQIGASKDRTGNLNYGGNWIMERSGEDIEQIYFTNSIHYYTYLLDNASDFTKAIRDASDCQILSKDISETNLTVNATFVSIQGIRIQSQQIATEFETNFATQAANKYESVYEIAFSWNNQTIRLLAFNLSKKASDTDTYQKEVLHDLPLIQPKFAIAQTYIEDATQYNASASQRAFEAKDASNRLQTGVTGDLYTLKMLCRTFKIFKLESE